MPSKKLIPRIILIVVILLVAALVFNRVESAKQKQAPVARALPVRAMKVLKKDTILVDEYVGQVQAASETGVRARVSGSVMEKYVNGGAIVKKGQPLFRIDTRQYESALLSAKGDLAQAEAIYVNSRRDTQRYQRLYAVDAIAEQTVTTQVATEKSNLAIVNAKRALVKQAQNDLDDTRVFAPIDGRLNVDDVSVGTYAIAGSTVLVTIGSTDPMYVAFNVSETDYLNSVNAYKAADPKKMTWGRNMAFLLSNGETYPHRGHVTEIDRGLTDNSGTLTMKATVPNPDGILIPDVFVRARTDRAVIKDALLIPQRSVQQLLDKSFVIIVDPNGTSVARTVELGRKYGSYWLVTSGLEGGEAVVVEGLTNLQEGVSLDVTMSTEKELQLSFPDENSPQ